MERSSKCVSDMNLIIIGRIGKPHGVKGEMRVYPLTDFPNRFENLHKAYIDDTAIDIVSSRYSNDFVIIKVKNFNDREKAAAATGKFLKIDRSDVAPLAEGEYYSFDIIGLAVYDEKNVYRGSIVNIIKTGSNDVYVVEEPETAKQILIPALKKIVADIDIKNKRMDITMPIED